MRPDQTTAVAVPVHLAIGDGGSVDVGELSLSPHERGDGLVEMRPPDGRPIEHHVAELLVMTAARLLDPSGDDPGSIGEPEPDEPAKGVDDAASRG